MRDSEQGVRSVQRYTIAQAPGTGVQENEHVTPSLVVEVLKEEFRCEWGSSSICARPSLLWDPRDRLDAISELIDVRPSEKASRMK
jgi:hypothetical protein